MRSAVTAEAGFGRPLSLQDCFVDKHFRVVMSSGASVSQAFKYPVTRTEVPTIDPAAAPPGARAAVVLLPLVLLLLTDSRCGSRV